MRYTLLSSKLRAFLSVLFLYFCHSLPLSFDHSHLSKCEVDTLRLGSDLGDIFNGPIDEEDWNERVHQNFLIKHMAFSPWNSNGIAGTDGKTLTFDDARVVKQQGGWMGRNISDSPYAILNHKWIYMYGDSTTRQIWASFGASFQGNNFERNAKEWTRHYCNGQSNRKHHPGNGMFVDEGWQGPCGKNEVTCHISGYGDEGLLTYDWKHFPYEDYDEFLFSDRGPWHKNSNERQPDILTIQTGLHTCWHADPSGLYSTHLHEVNTSMVDSHINGLKKLMISIRNAIDRRIKMGHAPTMVIIFTSGASYQKNGESIDSCIARMNRITSNLGHHYGFAVLERGEIERRIMYKSLYSETPFVTPEMHLAQPIQSIIATCLLNLITCLSANGSALGIKKTLRHNKHKANAVIGPLHSPPS
jgi:hypothetical protein